MSRYRTIYSIMFVCIFLLAQPLGFVDQTSQNFNNESTTPAAIDITQVLPDEQLVSIPDAYINGTSGEFQYSHQPNSIQLNWTHTAGTELDFHSYDDETFPQFNDFVYFDQSFDWPYNELPTHAELYLNFSVHLSGNFSTQVIGSNMFRIYAWFIDSSGNWNSILYTLPPYYTEIHSWRSNLNYFQRVDGWGGMIEDAYGVQEDPLDELSVGVGLVPTDTFLEYEGSHPWQTYSGSVIVNVTSVSLYTIMEAEPDPAKHLDPLYNSTYGTLFGDVYSGLPSEASTPLWDFVYAMTSDSDGNVYITGETFTNYPIHEETGIRAGHQTLLKYNPILGREYIVLNDNESRGRAITYNNEYLYTTGCNYRSAAGTRDLIVTKWTTNGQKLWEIEQQALNDQVGIAIAVHGNDSIYVVVSDYNMVGPEESDYYDKLVLMKFDTEGIQLWNKTYPLSNPQWDLPGELHIVQSKIFFSFPGYITTPGYIMYFDLDGNVLWEEESSAATSDEEGNIYRVSFTGREIEISKILPNGNTTWSTLFGIEYAPGWEENINPHDVTITPDNELLILVQGWKYDDAYYLLKYDLDGTLLQTWTIGDNAWPMANQELVMIEVAETGLLYCTFQHNDIWTQCFAIGEYTIPTSISSTNSGTTTNTGNTDSGTLTVVVAGVGIGIVALVGVIFYKKKGAT